MTDGRSTVAEQPPGLSLWWRVRSQLGRCALTYDEWLAIADLLPRPLTDDPIRKRRGAAHP